MNTHTVILKCPRKNIPHPLHFKSFICDELKPAQIFYFGRNGKTVPHDSQALMEDLRESVYIELSFCHLLKLEIEHAFAVIKEALKQGFIKHMRYNGNQIRIELH